MFACIVGRCGSGCLWGFELTLPPACCTWPLLNSFTKPTLTVLLLTSCQNPFTSGSFCNGTRPEFAHRRGNSYCPHHHGRSKLLLRPKLYREDFQTKVHVHGRLEPDPARGIVHFDTSVAHIKEWPGQFGKYAPTIRPARNFTVASGDEVGIHSFEKSHQMNEDGRFNMYYDAQLESWLEYVAGRRSSSNVA